MKSGYKTTEFWVSVIVAGIGLAVSLGFFSPDQQTALVEAVEKGAGLFAMVASAFGYSVARGEAKKNQLPK